MHKLRFDSEAMVPGLTAWVAEESPSHDAAAVNRMQDHIAAFFAGCAVGMERIAGRDGLADIIKVTAGPANGQAPVLIMSHVDTVHPVGTLANELPIRREGDKLYGPGIYDMKGGAYLSAMAFRHVVAQGGRKRPLVYLFTPDEEIGSPTTRALIETEGRHAAAVLVTEPARDGGRIVTARKGVGRFEATLEGRPAHSGSRHADGRNAIREAARQITFIEGLTDYARGITTTVAEIRGGTAANVIPKDCWFSIDLRVINGEDGAYFADMIRGLKPHDPDVKLSITGGMNRPPMPRTVANAGLYEHAVRVAAEFGLPLAETVMTGGGSDGNFTSALGAATLDGLGCDGDGAHTLYEHCYVSSLGPRAELMARMLETL